MDRLHKLDETSLARAYQHVVDKKVPRWGIATAYRSVNTPNENRKLNKQLEADIRAQGLGFFKVEGHWRECQNNAVPYHKCPEDQLVDATEDTFFIPNASKEFMKSIVKKYDQDSVIYGGPENKGNAHLIWRDGNEDNIGKMHPNTIGQAFSKFKDKSTFHFKKGRIPKQTNAGSERQQASLKKLSSMIPAGALDKRIKNPDTGRLIKVKTALGYDKTSPAYKTAFAAIKKPKK